MANMRYSAKRILEAQAIRLVIYRAHSIMASRRRERQYPNHYGAVYPSLRPGGASYGPRNIPFCRL